MMQPLAQVTHVLSSAKGFILYLFVGGHMVVVAVPNILHVVPTL